MAAARKPRRAVGPIERAVKSGDDARVIDAALLRCAMEIDGTTSARDAKSLMITLIDLVDKRRELRGLAEEPAAGNANAAEGDVIDFFTRAAAGGA